MLIDDHSRKLWAFVLKSKDQVLSFFKEFHARAERESGRKLKVVRTDKVESIEASSKSIASSKVFDSNIQCLRPLS